MCKLQYLIFLLLIQITFKFKYILMVKIGSSDNNYQTNSSHPPSMITVERVATFSNGCYKQRTIEPDVWNSNRYFETEQLICPSNVNASSMTVLTKELQKNNSLINTANFKPANNTPITDLSAPAVSSAAAASTIKQEKNQTNLMNFSHNFSHLSHLASNFSPAATFPHLPHRQQKVNSTVEQQQPFTTVVIPSNTTVHAVILSKKTGFHGHEKKKSSAYCLYNNFNWLFVFLVITIFFNLNLLRQ